MQQVFISFRSLIVSWLSVIPFFTCDLLLPVHCITTISLKTFSQGCAMLVTMLSQRYCIHSETHRCTTSCTSSTDAKDQALSSMVNQQPPPSHDLGSYIPTLSSSVYIIINSNHRLATTDYTPVLKNGDDPRSAQPQGRLDHSCTDHYACRTLNASLHETPVSQPQEALAD